MKERWKVSSPSDDPDGTQLNIYVPEEAWRELTSTLDSEKPFVEPHFDELVVSLRFSSSFTLIFPNLLLLNFDSVQILLILVIEESRLANLLRRGGLDDGKSELQDQNDGCEDDAEHGGGVGFLGERLERREENLIGPTGDVAEASAFGGEVWRRREEELRLNGTCQARSICIAGRGDELDCREYDRKLAGGSIGDEVVEGCFWEG